MTKAEKVSIGRIVHYVRHDGAHCAALVVGTVDDTTANLAVFEDGIAFGGGPILVTNVSYDADAAPQSWHWCEKV